MDFGSWQSVAATLLGMALFALIGIGIRLLMMVTCATDAVETAAAAAAAKVLAPQVRSR